MQIVNPEGITPALTPYDRRPRMFVTSIFLLLFGACALPGDDTGRQSPPCDCPNLVRVVESIEWAPGVTGLPDSDHRVDDQREVKYVFDVADARGEMQRLLDAFEDRGLPVNAFVDSDNPMAGFMVSGSGYNVSVLRLEGLLWITVRLVESTPDALADEVLQPVIEAIGLRN